MVKNSGADILRFWILEKLTAWKDPSGSQGAELQADTDFFPTSSPGGGNPSLWLGETRGTQWCHQCNNSSRRQTSSSSLLIRLLHHFFQLFVSNFISWIMTSNVSPDGFPETLKFLFCMKPVLNLTDGAYRRQASRSAFFTDVLGSAAYQKRIKTTSFCLFLKPSQHQMKPSETTITADWECQTFRKTSNIWHTCDPNQALFQSFLSFKENKLR